MKKCKILFDGKCSYCCQKINYIQNKDTDRVFDCISKHTLPINPLINKYPKGLLFIDKKEKLHTGADAVYQIAKNLKGYKTFAWIYKVPILHQIFRYVYSRKEKKRNDS